MGSEYAFIFDLDGVIIHSTPLHDRAWEIYLEKFGIPSERVQQRMHGLRNDDIVRDFFGDSLPPEEIEAHGAAKEALYRTLMKPQLAAYMVPGVQEFLRRHRDIPAAVASNAEPANVSFVLEDSGLADYFRFTVDGQGVARPKPAPDIYLKAAGLLGYEPRQCVVFEDSLPGVEAAAAAGMRVVGLTTTLRQLPHAEILIPDFTDPRLENWLKTTGVTGATAAQTQP